MGRFRYLTGEDRWEWSDEVARMHGYQPGTVSPTTELVLSHKHPDDKASVATLIEHVRRTGVPFSSWHRIVDAHGDVHMVVVIGEPIIEDGAAGTAGFYVDVTAEVNADVQAALSEAIVAVTERRAVINQAIGILMLRHGVPAEAAFDLLAAESQRSNVKLRVIAERFVAAATTGAELSQATAEHLDVLLTTAGGGQPRRVACGL